MKRLQAFLLAIALVATLSGAALAQDRDRDRHDRDRDERRDDHDRGKHRGWHRQHHDNGRHLGWYKQRDRDRDRDGDRDDYYGNGGRYGGYRNGGYGNDAASQFGYRDGLQAGQSDRATGHSYRPTQWEAYRDADHGLSSSDGYYSGGQYQQAYRQAFVEGYRQGYGANGYGGYRR